VKTALKSVAFDQVTDKNKLAAFHGSRYTSVGFISAT